MLIDKQAERLEILGANFAAFTAAGVMIQLLMGEDFKTKVESLLLAFAVARLIAITGITLPEEESEVS